MSQRISSTLAICFALLSFACQPKIGDDCVTDIDCSQTGERICDTTQVDGYCTIADCDPLNCPEKESICVAFNNTLSTQGACNVRGQTSPYRRTFCMGICEKSKDCRDGYSCVDMARENDWGATVIQQDPKETRVCVQAMTFVAQPEDQEDEVCTGAPGDDLGAGGAGGATN